MARQQKDVPLEQEDLRVIREMAWHSLQRADVSIEDRQRMVHLREHLGNFLDEN